MTMAGGAGRSSHKQNDSKMLPENWQDAVWNKNKTYSPFREYFCCRGGGGLPKKWMKMSKGKGKW